MKKSSAGTTSGSPNGTQADYPIGTGGLIYEDGMLWGVKVKDGNDQSPRVGGTTYYAGLKAGRVVYDASGNVIGSTDPADHHVWRVRSDYTTADLTADAANFFKTDEPTDAEVTSVYDQYDYDWNNWPASWGAPYDDVDANGSYDPTVDELFERVFWKSQLLSNEAYIFWKKIRDSEEGVSVKEWKEWIELRNISTGQYYNMIKGLRGAGFIERREGRYHISSKFLKFTNLK